MSRRIDIELTSSLNDGTWTWRAAGARQPKGVVAGSLLPDGVKVGDELKVEVDQEIDGITVLSVVNQREKQDRELLTLLPVEREFQPVIETRAKRDRGERPRRDDRDGPRRPRPDRGDRPNRAPGGERGRTDRPADANRGDRPRSDAPRGDARGGDRPRTDGAGGDRRPRRDRGERERRGPSFTPPPEIPQRPKPKRLRPGKTHRTAVLADLPAEQRPIAELALQGIAAVRQRLKEENDKATAEGRAVMPEASVMKLAEELLPKLRIAEWRDRAEAAKAQAADLDLRDLRSVVVASSDPSVARDETSRALADELKQVLATKQEQELQFWYGDIDAALAVGRVIRALRLSSQPPKAGVPFPSAIAQRLADSANASLTPMDAPDRWAAMLEAAAFSPVRTLVRPNVKPDVVSDELTATVTRLAPALPQVAELFGVEVSPKAVMPKPLRPNPRAVKGKPDGKPGKPNADAKPGERKPGDRPKRDPKPAHDQAEAAEVAVVDPVVADPEANAPESGDTPDTESPAPQAEATEPESTVADAPAPEAAEPEATEPGATEPEAPAPAAAEPEATEREAAEPAAAEPATAEPEAAEPATAEPEAPTAEPEATEPEATEPEAPAPATDAAE